jgi:hypothetical protein
MTSTEESVEPTDCVCIEGYVERVGGGCESDGFYSSDSPASRFSASMLKSLAGVCLLIWHL